MGRILLIAGLLTLVGCTGGNQTACSLEQSAVGALSSGIASTLNCTNVAAIQADVEKALSGLNMCANGKHSLIDQLKASKPEKYKGIVGDVVCPAAVQAAVALASSKIPASWSCSPSKTGANLSSILTTACESAIPL